MKALVVYDSVFGNTQKIAVAIAEAIRAATGGAGTDTEVEARRASETDPGQLRGVQLLVVGSPTRAFRPTKAATAFLKNIASGSLEGVSVAAFDTRADVAEVNSRILTALVKLFGYAAEPMARRLVSRGGRQVAEPAGFYVTGTEGPLKEGELERAAAWARQAARAAMPTG
jgi:flavodoxin